MTEQRQISKTIDVWKLFFAFCVVAIHTKVTEALPEDAAYWVLQLVLRMGVPFFFVVSGFFLMRKLQTGADAADVVKTYVLRLLGPFIVIDAANALLNVVYKCLTEDTQWQYALQSVVRKGFWYPYGAMWFVSACIVGALLLLPFIQRDRLNLALAIGAVLYAWALLCNNYYFLVEGTAVGDAVTWYMDHFVSARNGVFQGFFLLALGMKTYAVKDRMKYPALWAAAGLALFVLELYLLKGLDSIDDASMYIGHILFVPAFVIFCCDRQIGISDEASRVIRKMSIWVFFVHRLILILLQIILVLAGVEKSVVLEFLVVSLTAAVTFFIFMAIRKKLRRTGSAGWKYALL